MEYFPKEFLMELSFNITVSFQNRSKMVFILSIDRFHQANTLIWRKKKKKHPPHFSVALHVFDSIFFLKVDFLTGWGR